MNRCLGKRKRSSPVSADVLGGSHLNPAGVSTVPGLSCDPPPTNSQIMPRRRESNGRAHIAVHTLEPESMKSGEAEREGRQSDL